MNTFYMILFLLATVCFLVAAFNLVASRVNLVALGLSLWVLVPLIQALRSL